MMKLASIIFLGTLLTACGDAPLECGAPASIAGAWSYEATQTAPSAATLSGTLTLTRPGTCAVGGTVAGTIDTGDGSPEMFDAGVSGVFLDETTVDLSIGIDGERRHIGEVVADTISGTWADGSSGATGIFRAERGTP